MIYGLLVIHDQCLQLIFVTYGIFYISFALFYGIGFKRISIQNFDTVVRHEES